MAKAQSKSKSPTKKSAPQQLAFALNEEPPRWARPEAVARTLARASDPPPSHAAARDAAESGQASGDSQTILKVLRESYDRTRGPRGSMTAKEIAFFANWLLGSQPNNVRVSRRMAALTTDLIDKPTGRLIRKLLVIVTGERASFDRSDEKPITSYARIDSCCGQVKNWVRVPLPFKEGEKPRETRVCKVCDAALGVGDVGAASGGVFQRRGAENAERKA
jgi:hypothetical protein